MKPRTARPIRPTARRGFTLIELLIVIAIITVLATLTTVASVRFIGSAREAATRTTIKKVEEAVKERVASLNRWHQRPINRLEHDWQFRGWIAEWADAGLDAAGNVGNRNTARMVLSRKGMLREMLPVVTDDLIRSYWFWAKFDTDGTVGLSTAERTAMTNWLKDTNPDVAGDQTLDTPGEVFYYALLNAPVFGGLRVPDDEFKPSELVDPDDDGLYEIADAWKQSLRFYRWPTRLVNNYTPAASTTWGDAGPRKTLMPNAPTEALDLKVDADDRAGFLSTPHPVSFGGKLVVLAPVLAFHDANTWHAPLVVSAGSDGILGIAEPSDSIELIAGILTYGLAAPPATTDPDYGKKTEGLYDNITNQSGRAGAL